MPKVSDELVSLIKRQIEEHGIVVWYDPEGHYARFVKGLSIPETTILKYDGSFFELRYRMEPFLEFVDEEGNISDNPDIPPKLLIYVPLRREDTEYALAEAEAYGVVMEPGASPWQRNTRLRVLAERVFKKIAPEDTKDIIAKIDQGLLHLEELDQICEKSRDFSPLRFIFDTSNSREILLKFLGTEDLDHKIAEKDALAEIAVLVKNICGLEVTPKTSVESFKRDLARRLMLAEFVLKLEEAGSLPQSLANIPVPQEEIQRKEVLEICNLWRNHMFWRENYAKYANQIAAEIPFDSLNIPVEALQEVETFAPVEKRLLSFVEEQIIKENYQGIKEIIEKRKNSFWASFYPEKFKLHWLVLEGAFSLLEEATSLRREVPHIERSLAKLVESYASGAEDHKPWYMLDRLQRLLESRYARLDVGVEDDPQLERVIFLARKSYVESASLVAEALLEALKKKGLSKGPAEKPLLRQREIFGKRFRPLLSEGKTAYILVDALRYEMGVELAEGLGDEFEVKVEAALGELPSITQVGMAALMPGAEEGLQIVATGRGKIGVQVGEALLRDRNSRLKYLTASLEGPVSVLKLNELVKLRKRKREELEAARVIVVTSQEIDLQGEKGEDETEARIYMDEVLGKLRRGVRALARLGVKHILIAADHGFVFLDEVEEAMLVDPPGGETLEIHSRVWIGRGGSSSPSYESFRAEELGLKSEFDFVFPRGLACFRVKGGEGGFFHGGISFPEMIIPVVLLSPRKMVLASTPQTSQVKLDFPQKRITNRFFTIRLTYVPTGLFRTERQKVRVLLKCGREVIGGAIAATYGFEEGSREITLEKERENTVTVMLEKEDEMVSLYVLEANTEVELAAVKNIEVDLTI